MSFRDKSIRIDDWAGKLLFLGPYDDKQVDVVLDTNRCQDCITAGDIQEDCKVCEGTGYSRDFEVDWIDESDKDDCNVYEYINY